MRSESVQIFAATNEWVERMARPSIWAIALAILASAGAAKATETTSYSYDALGRIIAAQSAGTVNHDRIQSWCYDAAGNRTLAKSDGASAAATCGTSAPGPAPAPTISIGDTGAFEGEGLLFTVTLSEASPTSISVEYAAADGSAGMNDYYLAYGTVTFAAGVTSQTIEVSTADDLTLELDETLSVNLSGPNGASIADGQGIGTIFDDDFEGGCSEGPVLCY